MVCLIERALSGRFDVVYHGQATRWRLWYENGSEQGAVLRRGYLDYGGVHAYNSFIPHSHVHTSDPSHAVCVRLLCVTPWILLRLFGDEADVYIHISQYYQCHPRKQRAFLTASRDITRLPRGKTLEHIPVPIPRGMTVFHGVYLWTSRVYLWRFVKTWAMCDVCVRCVWYVVYVPDIMWLADYNMGR